MRCAEDFAVVVLCPDGEDYIKDHFFIYDDYYLDDNGKIYGYRHSDVFGTEIIVDTLVNKVYPGSVLIDKLGTVSGISNTAHQTDNGMDLFLPTDTALKSVGLTICERIYKPVTEQIKQETVAPEVMPAPKRK